MVEDPAGKRTRGSAIPWARANDDPWLGSRRVVPVRPHIRSWLQGRTTGPFVEIGPGLRPTAPIRGSHFVDRSAHVLELLHARGADVSVADGGLPFTDGSIGAAVAFEVFEHVPDDAALFREVARVVRPDGMLLMSVPIRASMWTPLDDACGHVRRYEPDELFAATKAAGFEVRGYMWAPAGSAVMRNLQARILTAGRPIATKLVQNLIFPIQAAWDRFFGKVAWSSPDEPVPSAADDLVVWLERTDGQITRR